MEEISLEKSSQKKFKKSVNKLKRDIKDGEITVQETRPKKLKGQPKAERGLIYLGHIPHGFYEKEMRDFFSQFGIVTRVKLCRSEKSGRSKGYGYVEFLHTKVAEIAAETMNNYLMFKRRLVAEYISPEKQKRIRMNRTIDLKKLPGVLRRNKELRKKNQKVDGEKYIVQCKKEVKHLKSKLEKLKELGIEHTVKPVNVPEKSIVALVGDCTKKEEKVAENHSCEETPQKKRKSTLNETKIAVETAQKKRKSKLIQTKIEVETPQKKIIKNKVTEAKISLDESLQGKVDKATQTPEKKKTKKIDVVKRKLSKKGQESFEKKLRRKSVTLK